MALGLLLGLAQAIIRKVLKPLVTLVHGWSPQRARDFGEFSNSTIRVTDPVQDEAPLPMPQSPPVLPLGRSVGKLGCSCLVAPVLLLTSGVFLFLQELVPPFGPYKTALELPDGCPPGCAGLEIRHFDLTGYVFADANCEGAKFPETVLNGVDFHGANLRNASLFWSDLRNTNFSGADMAGADLRKAILSGAQFQNATLTGAYLRDAALQRVDFSTADLRGADFRGASYNAETSWPPGFDVEGSGLRLVEKEAFDDWFGGKNP
ncbi:MAG: pentapeptide repeat-containing protein [Acidobacteria bacterium]|nr:pentapeptide repeat-containing protein [Acidobacteriota bacterium]